MALQPLARGLGTDGPRIAQVPCRGAMLGTIRQPALRADEWWARQGLNL